MHRRAFLGGAAGLSLSAMASSPNAQPARPLIIAHRGASGLRPEHTLEGYALAAELGADVIEPDLVFTKDGHLICRHDRYLSGSTNVADMPMFADRKTQKPGHEGPDWFAEDFTLDEIKALRARQAFPGRSAAFDDQFEVPTFEELLSLAKASGWRLYPEAKDPAAATRHGHDFMAALKPFFAAAKAGDIAPSFLQCFDPAFLMPIAALPNIKRIQLLGLAPPSLLAQIAPYADGVGPNKEALFHAGSPPVSSGFVEEAHRLGLAVHPWTFRSDALSAPFETPTAEYAFFYALGVDGVFSDFSGEAARARALLR